MATSDISYCTERELMDVYPSISDFDTKTRITGWASTTLDSITSYVSYNTGLVSQLYIDGASQQAGSQEIGKTAATAINHGLGYGVGATSIVVDDGSVFTDPQYIKIGSEILGITAISTNTLTVTRAELGTSAAAITNDDSIYNHFIPSANGQNLYDSDNDFLIMRYNVNPIDSLTEAGDDYDSFITRMTKKASRIIEGRIAYRVQDEIHKDREGNYPAIIVHATALQTVILLLRANDPNMEDIAPLKEELDEIIEGIISGTIKLGLINSDSSKGIVRQVSVSAASDLFPVELKGNYTGSGYELLKIKIESGEAGVIGTAQMTVTGKSSTALKADVLVDSETITGDFQSLGVGSLEIRWSGDDVITATTTNNDEYEIELWGSALESSVTSTGSIKMTRI